MQLEKNAFECQLEPQLSPTLYLKRLKTHEFPLTNCLNPAICTCGQTPLDLSEFTTLFLLQYKYFWISSMIRVLSIMYMSKMILKRKKSYRPKSGESGRGRACIRVRVPINMHLYKPTLHRLHEHDEVKLVYVWGIHNLQIKHSVLPGNLRG